MSSALVIWSYSLADPRHPFGTDAVVHNYKGSSKLNLIGRVPTVDTAPSEGIPFIDVITENVGNYIYTAQSDIFFVFS